MLIRQVEMFAGVIASSMPTVKQFFSRQIFSLTSLNFSSIRHLRSRSARVKLSDDDPSFTGWGGSNTHTSEGREGFRMKGLESDGYKQKVEKAPRVRDSKIYLTRDISDTQE